jgi:Leucine-rich repeat (LRR) protein
LSPSPTVSAYRRVTPPLTPDAFAPLPEDCKGIQFSQPLAEDEYRQLAELLNRQPDKELFALQVDSTRYEHITDLRFLQFFPDLRIFASTLELLQSLEGVEYLQRADKLFIHKALHRMSAAPLAGLTDLRELWLDGQFSDRGMLRELTGVTNFKMGYAAKLTDLSFLPPNLTRFSMNLGSVADISALAGLPHLQQLLFHKVHSIADLSPLANATGLRTLYLAFLNKVTHLFDMSALADLTELTVTGMSRLTDLRPVLTAPNLTNLTVYDLPALDPDSWRDTCIGWLAQGKPPFWE